jgi:hypothetical protein
MFNKYNHCIYCNIYKHVLTAVKCLAYMSLERFASSKFAVAITRYYFLALGQYRLITPGSAVQN